MDLSAIGGSALGFIGDWLNAGYAEDRQNNAQGFSAQQFATRYQTTVKDLQAAGLNPMLAYGSSGPSAPSGSVVGGAPYGDVTARFNQSRVASAQVANIEADTENKKASADLIASQAAANWSGASQAQANVEQIKANTDKIREETANIPTEGARLRQAVQLLAEQAAKTAQEGATQVEVRNQIAATIAKLQAETGLLKLDEEAAKKLDNMGREFGQLKPFIDTIVQMLRVNRR